MSKKQAKRDVQKGSITTSSYASPQDWRTEARRRFGDDPMGWEFVCPVCGHIASLQDWKDAGATIGEAAFSCVGRRTKAPRGAFEKGEGPCDYAGGGLFRFNPVCIKDGVQEYHVFDFANERGG